MPFEVTSATIACSKCGTVFKTKRGNFYTCNAPNYRGIGRLTMCKKCVDAIFATYLSVCNDVRLAVRQVCRKLDIMWSDEAFEYVQKRNTSEMILSAYLSRINSSQYVGKSYDETLTNEGTMWDFTDSDERTARKKSAEREAIILSGDDNVDELVSQDVIDFWGPGFTASRYEELEHQREMWMKKFPVGYELDAGTEALIKQICNLELLINRESAAGRQIDKYVNTLNTLLGSAMLKPTQKAGGSDSAAGSTPFGVWIRRWENSRPIPEVKPELKDVDGIKKYVSVWFLGHLAKMLGLKKADTTLYDREVEKLRVERPEYNEEDDDTFINDIFADIEAGESDAG